MPQVPSALAASRELARDTEFQEIIKAATFRAVQSMGAQIGTTPLEQAIAAQRLVLVERVVLNQDPTWTASLYWAMATNDSIVRAYVQGDRAVSALSDEVVMVSLEAVWRLFGQMLTQVAVANGTMPMPGGTGGSGGSVPPATGGDGTPADPTDSEDPPATGDGADTVDPATGENDPPADGGDPSGT